MSSGERTGRAGRVVAIAAGIVVGGCASRGGSPMGELARPAQDVPPPAHALTLYCGGLDALLADPRDAGLRRALGMLDARLLELPAELEKPIPPGIPGLVIDIVSSPWQLTVDLVEGGDWSAAPPIRAQLTVLCADAAAADSLFTRFDGLVSMLAPFPTAPVAGESRLKAVELPVGRITFGSPAGSDRFLLAWGEPMLEAPALGALGLPAGVEPAFALEADLGKVREPIEHFLAQGGDDAQHMRSFLEWLGILGPDPLALSVAVGHGADRGHFVARYHNWKKVAARQGSLAAEPLTAAELRMIPADATVAMLQRFDPLFLVDLLDLFAHEHGGAPRDELEALLGLELDADILGPLGKTFGLYLSDTTGGGGLASLIAFVAVEDETRLRATLAKGIAKLHELTQGEAEGHFRIRDWEHAGARCQSLAFPGIPIPLEVSLATADGFLLVAATPAGLVAALDHARGDAPGLPEHPALARLGAGALDSLQCLQFSDTPRLLDDGYVLASLAASAIANGVRSPIDTGREPGLVLPPFGELLAGSRPSILLSRLEGDDLVTVGECDNSAVANATAWLGGPGAYVLALGMMAGAAVPAVMGVRHAVESASAVHDSKSLADIFTIHAALDLYAQDHLMEFPATLEALVTPDADGRTYLDRDSLPVDPWGNPYQYEPPSEERPAPRVYSFGADGLPGGEGQDADIDGFQFASSDSGN